MNKGIVATGSYEATQAAADILRSGGNAFDAAISAVFTSMTTELALTVMRQQAKSYCKQTLDNSFTSIFKK